MGISKPFLSYEGASPTAAFKFSNIDFFSPAGGSSAATGAAGSGAGAGGSGRSMRAN